MTLNFMGKVYQQTVTPNLHLQALNLSCKLHSINFLVPSFKGPSNKQQMSIAPTNSKNLKKSSSFKKALQTYVWINDRTE